jgi:hypothetical protein
MTNLRRSRELIFTACTEGNCDTLFPEKSERHGEKVSTTATHTNTRKHLHGLIGLCSLSTYFGEFLMVYYNRLELCLWSCFREPGKFPCASKFALSHTNPDSVNHGSDLIALQGSRFILLNQILQRPVDCTVEY